MRGDTSRDTFDPVQHFSSVRLQQGRIVTDADWNEQADLTRYRAERQAQDIIGDCGAPIHIAGFGLAAATYPLSVFSASGSPGSVWVVGEDGVVLKTLDNGATWSIVDLNTTAHLRAIQFVGDTGWAIGDSGTVRKTTAGGTAWGAQQAGVTTSLRGLSVFDATHVWAVGDGGIVVYSSDGGTTWHQESVHTGRLNAIHFPTVSNGIAVGHGGVIIRSTDGGDSWSKIQTNMSVHLRALSFSNPMTGWAAGDDGTILKTADGGLTWTGQSTPTHGRLQSVIFRDLNEGWAVGDGGLALQTNDGGTTWVQTNVGTSETLRSVSLPSGQPGWAVGDMSVAVRLDSGSPSVVPETLPGVSFSITPGRFYAHGTLCELEERSSFYNQPDRGRPARLAVGLNLVYLHVWQRHMSFLESPGIREIALGGVDTATRAKTVCQVKALPLPVASPPAWNCLSDVEDWTSLVTPSRARLRARSEPQPATTGVCEIAAAAGYRRVENQLYRVEVHDGGNTPTFKWSRENGSVGYAIESITDDTVKAETIVRLASRGRDENLDLAADDWVEIVDDDAALEQRVGVLSKYDRDGDDTGDDTNEIVLTGVIGNPIARDATRHPLLRRWEQKPSGTSGTLAIEEGKWISLEDGVEVWFEPAGSYRPGDYWLIPARTITSDVEWPRDDDDEPVALPPAGIEDHYCRLGIIQVYPDGRVEIVSDCRTLFPPITELDQLLYVSGDGQDGIPGVELPQPLVVRVARGQHPVAAARVRFEIESGSGSLVGVAPLSLIDVDTDSEGLVSCRWILDADPKANARYQRLRATLLDAAGQPLDGQRITFCASATLSLQYVSGDGQETQSGQQLAHPLEVRVQNGQSAVANVLVRFTPQGGGQLIGVNPIVTGADGMARISWQLGASDFQRVEAELMDGAGAAVQHIGFNARIVPQATGGGCAVTIGERGQVKQLNTETLRKLLDELKGNVCLCFLPGEHVIDDLRISGDSRLRVSIHGCGHSSIVRLGTQVQLSGFASVEISALSVVADVACGFAFGKCIEVRFTDNQADAADARETPFMHFVASSAITVSGNRIRTKMPGLALIFEDARAITHFSGNDIEGIVSFYGRPAGAVQEVNFKALRERLPDVAFQQGNGRLCMSSNNLELLTVGRQKVAELNAIAAGQSSTLTALYSSATVQGNAISAPNNLFVSRFLSLSSCSLLSPPDDTKLLGVFVAEGAAAVGNVAMAILERLMLVIVARRDLFGQAGNAVFISGP